MKLRTLSLAALVLVAIAVAVVLVVRTRGRGEIEASTVLDPYLRRLQAGEHGMALEHWAEGAERRPTVETLREGWDLRMQQRGSLERWTIAAAIPGGNVFSGESWVDARVWLYFSDAPGQRVPVEWRIAEVEGTPKITRSVVSVENVGADDAERAW
jgi:hypothetical protein